MSRRVSDIVEPIDDNCDKSSETSDSGSYDDEVNMDACNRGTVGSSTLPAKMNWPPCLIVNKHCHKYSVVKQFCQPATFSKRMDVQNKDVNFTICQYQAAWAEVYDAPRRG